jgi:hypothetical protein
LDKSNYKQLLFYDSLSEFKKQFYKDLLTSQHLIPGEIKINKLDFASGGSQEHANFWGYMFEKDGKKYLLESKDINGLQVDLSELMPFMAEDLEKVASKGIVYWLVNKPISAKFRPQKCMQFRDLVNVFSSFAHSNPVHQKLLVFIALTSMMDRANFRISTPPGFGKDSIVDTMGALVGNAATVENPTLAKLEYMTAFKWLVVNEINDIGKSEWKVIEQFLLSAGAHKSEVTKHSRATANGVKEILNIKNFSLALLYNDIDCYPDMKDYIDFITKKAVLDRFPAFRFYGSLMEDFNLRNLDVEKLVKDNFSTYKELLYTFSYFKQNLSRELKHFSAEKLSDMPQRWKINIGRLLKIIDLYCKDQDEFDYWINVINDSLIDYKEMLSYPLLLKQLDKKGKKVTPEIELAKTFVDKRKMINLLLVDKLSKGSSLWSDKNG